MQIALGTPETFEVIQSSTWQIGNYKGYLICGSQFGFFIVQPSLLVLTFAGYIVYAGSPQEAGAIVDGHLAIQKPSRGAPATMKRASKKASTSKKRKAPVPRHRSSSHNALL